MPIILKRNGCRLATILCGLVAIGLSSQLGLVTWPWPENQPVGLVPGLLSAIFGTQWIHYQKRLDTALNRSHWPGWLRRLLY